LKKRRVVDEDVIIGFQDRCSCLRILFESALEIDEVIGKGGKIDKLFQLEYEEGKEPNEGTKLTSIHRAKGLEASRVLLLRPEKLPHPMAKTKWAKEQEMNLKYVAITRAIDEFVYVRTEERESDERDQPGLGVPGKPGAKGKKSVRGPERESDSSDEATVGGKSSPTQVGPPKRRVRPSPPPPQSRVGAGTKRSDPGKGKKGDRKAGGK
jgi:hypothetical protein